MRHIKSCVFLASTFLFTGCAEIGALNNKVGQWAEEVNTVLNADRQEFQDELTSKRDIDTLYVRVKRELGFKTKEEAMKCNPNTNLNCRWVEAAVTEGGFLHEKTPGVYYRMADSFAKQGKYYMDVTLEKDGSHTRVIWKVRGSKDFADEIKAELLKTAK